MRICTTMALLLTLILLFGCGSATGPLGKWALDTKEMKVRWDLFYQDLVDDTEEEEDEEGNPTLADPFITGQQEQKTNLIEAYAAMGLILEIKGDGTFLHHRKNKNSKGKGTWEMDDKLVTLKPKSGANFIQGMKSMKLKYSGHLLTEHFILRPDKKNARPALLFRRHFTK